MYIFSFQGDITYYYCLVTSEQPVFKQKMAKQMRNFLCDFLWEWYKSEDNSNSDNTTSINEALLQTSIHNKAHDL